METKKYAEKLEAEGLHNSVEKIVNHFPHLAGLAASDAKNFALNATNLVAVDGVPIVDYWKLAKIATSNGWGGRRKGAGAPVKSVHKATKSRGIRMTDEEYEKVKKFLQELRAKENN